MTIDSKISRPLIFARVRASEIPIDSLRFLANILILATESVMPIVSASDRDRDFTRVRLSPIVIISARFLRIICADVAASVIDID